MVGFAPVAPIWLLQKLGSVAGRYHLPLAHDVLEHKREYDEFFKPLSAFSDTTIILDNSVIELGDSVDISVLLEAAEWCHANYLVLPDCLEDGGRTRYLSLQAYEQFDRSLSADRAISLAVVPQGRSLTEWIKCAEELNKCIPIGMWCIPRNFEQRLGSRIFAAKILRCLNPSIPIHMLGFSDFLHYDIINCQAPNVIGIDSAVPLRLGQSDTELQLWIPAGKRGTWWEDTTEETPLIPQTIKNMHIIRSWLNA